MAFRIRFEREVAAPAPILWEAVSDLAAYGQWNPFVVSCRSSLEPGDPIHMKVRVLPWFAQPQTETVFEHVAGRTLSYGLAKGPVLSRRSHLVEDAGGGRSRYVSDFELSGPLAPLVRALLGASLERGFRAMTDALVRRAEALSAARTTEAW